MACRTKVWWHFERRWIGSLTTSLHLGPGGTPELQLRGILAPGSRFARVLPSSFLFYFLLFSNALLRESYKILWECEDPKFVAALFGQIVSFCVHLQQQLSSCWDGRPFGHKQTWAQNWEGLFPLFRGARSPSNTMKPGPRPTSVPIGILIHPTVWPQYARRTF